MRPLPSEAACTSSGVSATSEAGSWLSLVAAATLGMGFVCKLRAEVSANTAGWPKQSLRLIVQAYAPDALDAQGLPALDARPLASTQRIVRTEDLAQGISVDLIQLETRSMRRECPDPLVALSAASSPHRLRVEAKRPQWVRPPAGKPDAVLMAWLEPDEADLDFDALRARPAPNAWFGLAPISGPSRIVLRRSLQKTAA